MKKKQSSLVDRVPNWMWLLLSFLAAMLLWYILSIIPKTSRAFPNQFVVLSSIATMIQRGVLHTDIGSSLISAGAGYAFGFIIALPVAILMAWYRPVKYIIEPWIQFIRNIPPLAYVPLIVIAAGVGRRPQIIVITIATFLIMCVTIYQGVVNVDETLIKAARVLGANDKDIFARVIAPATLPFILTAVRLGASVALTTLIAAEMTGTFYGLGSMIQTAQIYFRMDKVLLGIICIGAIGFVLDRLLLLAEKRITRWK